MDKANGRDTTGEIKSNCGQLGIFLRKVKNKLFKANVLTGRCVHSSTWYAILSLWYGIGTHCGTFTGWNVWVYSTSDHPAVMQGVVTFPHCCTSETGVLDTPCLSSSDTAARQRHQASIRYSLWQLRCCAIKSILTSENSRGMWVGVYECTERNNDFCIYVSVTFIYSRPLLRSDCVCLSFVYPVHCYLCFFQAFF